MTEELILGIEELGPSVIFDINITDSLWPPTQNIPTRKCKYETSGTFVHEYHARSPSGKGRHQWHSYNSYKRIAEHTSVSAVVDFPAVPEYPDLHAGNWHGEFTTPIALVDPTVIGSADQTNSRFDPMYSIVDQNLVFPVPNGGDFLQHALNSMLPGIRAGLLSLASIYELKDMAHLASSVSRILDTMRRIRLIPLGTRKGIWRRDINGNMTMRELSRRGSDVYLQYMFNFHPLYQDIKSFIKSLMSYRRQLRRLLDNAAKVRTSHYVTSVLPNGSDSTLTSEWRILPGTNDPEGVYWSPNLLYRSKGECVYEPTKLHAELEFSYTVSEFERRHAGILALLDSLGVNSNLATIWAEIPYSFIADWFVHVQSWLSDHAMRNIEPVVYIRRGLWSATSQRKLITSICLNSESWQPASVVKETTYSRNLFQPTSDQLQAGGMDLTKFTLAAALVLTK